MPVEMASAKDIFLRAVEIAEPQERDLFLLEACCGDAQLRRRIEDLLFAHQRPESLLDQPVVEAGPLSTSDTVAMPAVCEQAGTRIGPYRLMEQIGEGGMGLVFVAEQSAPVRRKVALKIIKPGLDTREVVARFEAERQALALMDHPHIARVFDAGATDSGRPYFVMELVRGAPITGHCDQHRLSPRERLRLFVDVCHAVQHAHQKGIIHRDIKPSNVLVSLHDGRPVVKVIDFGVAKAVNQEIVARTLYTRFAEILGTPLYMSPEQAEQSGLDVDTRSDIYSLGVLLYELLTGMTPFDRQRLSVAAFDEMRRIIREEEPPRPSTRVSTVGPAAVTLAANRRTDPVSLRQCLTGDLDWIVMKALEKDRTRRYESAAALGSDVERHLVELPVLARPPSRLYLLQKFGRRNRRALAAAALFAVAMLVTLAAVAGSVGWVLHERSVRQAQSAEVAQRALDRSTELLRAKNWSQSLAEARQAEAALSAGALEGDFQQQVSERLKDLTMVNQLEQIRLEKSDWVEQAFDFRAAEAAYQSAFREFGIDPEKMTTVEIANLISQRAIRDELTLGLDDWAHAQRILRVDSGDWRKLLEVASLVDRDEVRNRLRAIWVQEAGADVGRKFGAIATPENIRSMPPTTLYLLTVGLKFSGQRAEELKLLRQAQSQFPRDFWINFLLADALANIPPPDWDGAIRYYSVALTLRPESAITHNNLSNVLRSGGSIVESIAASRRSIELAPELALAHANLGLGLARQGKLNEALASARRAVELNPSSSFTRNSLGEVCKLQGNKTEALECFLLASQLSPPYHTAFFNLGLLLQESGKFAEALAAYQRAAEISPHSATYQMRLGIALKALGRADEAIAAYRRAIELNPRHTSAYTNLGLLLLGQREYSEASAALRRAVELEPLLSMAHANLGLSLFRLGKLDEAVASYRRALELDGENPVALGNLAPILRGRGEVDEAMTLFRRAIQLDRAAAGLRYGLGRTLGDKGDHEGAIAAYREAIRLKPDYADAHSSLGYRLMLVGQPEEAIACFRKAIEIDPQLAMAHVNLGDALLRRDHVDEAIVLFRRAIVLEPGLALAHSNLATALLLKNDPPQALVHTRQAIELDPKSGRAFLNHGWALSKLGQITEAMESYRAAIDRDPTLARPRSNLAWHLAHNPAAEWFDPYEANVLAKKATTIEPQNAQHWSNLGVAQFRANRWPEALASLERAKKLQSSGDLEHRAFLAMTYEKLGRHREAVEAFEEALDWFERNKTSTSLPQAILAEAEALLKTEEPPLGESRP